MRLLTVPGQPHAKGRPRFTQGGRVFTPQSTRLSEKRIAERAILQNPRAEPMEGAVILSAVFVFEPPASWPIWKRSAAMSASIHPDGKPDLDNLVKLLKDGLTAARWWHDDDQVVKTYAEKRYGFEAQTVVGASELPPTPTTKREHASGDDVNHNHLWARHMSLFLGMLECPGEHGDASGLDR